MQNYLDQVSEQTNDNFHTDALITIAKYVAKKHNQLEGMEKLIGYGQAINALHDFYGHMPSHLNQVRDDYRNRVFSFLNEDEATAFNNAL